MVEIKDYAIIVILLLIFGAFITGFRIELPWQFGNGGNETTTTTTLLDCDDYDLYDEFVDEFGSTLMRDTEDTCEDRFPAGLSGTYYEDTDIVGCLYNPAFPDIDCDAEDLEDAEDLCEDDLQATWICDNDVAFVGCVCKRGEPDWSPPEGITEEDFCQVRGDQLLAAFLPDELFCAGECENGLDCLTLFNEDTGDIVCYCAEGGPF